MAIKNSIIIIAKNIAIAIAFFIGGYIGLQFATPPAYATMIWPASGIALAALLIWGRGIISGIFIGSICIQLYITLFYKLDGNYIQSLPIALGIAFGSTLQAVIGAYLVRKYCNFPNIFSKLYKIILFLILSGPVACLIAASIGNYTLWYSGIIPIEAINNSWFEWWVGDSAGVILFAPVLYIVYGNLTNSSASKKYNYGMRLVAVLALAVPLSITYYLWQKNIETDLEYKKNDFLYLVSNSRKALTDRLMSYELVLKSAAAMVNINNDTVTREQWKKYAELIELENNYKEIRGLGYVLPVDKDNIDIFVKEQQDGGFPDFKIKPEILDDNFVITYVEPAEHNLAAIGLNLAFEKNRKDAAIASKDSGNVTITNQIILVQDNKKTSAFLLFLPIYKNKMPIDTVKERKLAFNGWVYSPFLARNFFYNLTEEQSRLFRLKIYEGFDIKEDKKIFDSNFNHNKSFVPKFVKSHPFYAYQKPWTIEWSSTEIFENKANNDNSNNILIGGFALTGLMCLFMLFVVGRTQQIQQSVDMQTLELRASQAELVKSEDVLRTAMDHAPIGMALITPQGDWIRVNEAVYELFGYDPGELESIKYHDLMTEDHKQYTSKFYALLNREINSYQIEKCALHKMGYKIWLLVSVSAVYRVNGEPEYIIVQLEDITQRKEIEHIKAEFVSVVSHELRTPLTSIRGALGLITGALRNEVSAKAMHLIEMAQRNSDRLVLLVNDILDIDKIALGAMKFDIQSQNIANLVNQAIDSNIAYAAQLNVKLISNLDKQILYIAVDDNRFIQVLSNLISNASKFSHAGGQVHITTSVVNGRARIEVQDFGVGMPPEFSERIFNKFAQADSSLTRAKGGSGLGLFITKQIVENMGGAIDYKSELGKGSSFWVDFPIIEGVNNKMLTEQMA